MIRQILCPAKDVTVLLAADKYSKDNNTIKPLLKEHLDYIADKLFLQKQSAFNATMRALSNQVDAHELMKALLNHYDTHENKSDKLLTFISRNLSEKTNTNDIDANNALSVETARQKKQNVHSYLTSWFATFESMRKNLWNDLIDSRLIGKAAPDHGFYSDNYTEISLIKQATFLFHLDGLMELKIHNTDAYGRHYAKDCMNFAVLEEELRAIFGYLDLHFLPNQNFHERVVFDQDSSNTLKNWGFHFSEAVCKEALRNKYISKIFAPEKISESEHSVTFLTFMKSHIGFFVNHEVRRDRIKREIDEAENKQKRILEEGRPLMFSIDL